MLEGFLYTEVVILSLFLSMRMSRNGSFPLLSFSIVNVMGGLCVLRCFKNFSSSLSPWGHIENTSSTYLSHKFGLCSADAIAVCSKCSIYSTNLSFEPVEDATTG